MLCAQSETASVIEIGPDGTVGDGWAEPFRSVLAGRYFAAYQREVASHMEPVAEVLRVTAMAMDDLLNGQPVTIPVRPDKVP